MARILIVEDSDLIRDAVTEAFSVNGHDPTGVATLQDAMGALAEHSFDAIILDIRLPDGNGYKLAQQIRETSGVPIIFLTAKDSESERVMGFEVGADDYVVKPFLAKELLLRVEAILRRAGRGESGSRETRSVWCLEDRTLAITREHILSECLDRPYDGAERTVDTHIGNIRALLGEAEWIETVRGFGYRFVGEREQ